MTVEQLEWDARILGLWSGVVDLSAQGSSEVSAAQLSTALSATPQPGFITIKLAPEQRTLINFCLHSGASLIDFALSFVFDSRFVPAPADDTATDYQFLRSTDPAPFLPLAEAMTHSRFFQDPRIGCETAAKLWRQSIHDHCTGFADELLIALCRGVPCGLTTIRFRPDDAVQLHIVGVLEQWRGRGIAGSMLQQVAQKYALLHDIYVETQSTNAAAIRAYQNCGFRLDHCTCVLHHWR